MEIRMSIISLNSVNKVYNETIVPVYALSDLSLEIEKGEFTAIVGPSGSGKTTLLNMIGGLDTPNSGTVEINQQDISTFSSGELTDFRLKHIGFVFQAYNLIPVLTAKENVEFIMLLQKRSKMERDKRSIKLLADVGLEDKIDIRPLEMSGGQQQRVAVARALASNPDFVLADEPTANLDSQSAENLLDLMEKMNQEHNITFIFSSHDEKVIRRARRVITLVDGKITNDEKK
jgi:putative ABC transport system ATP-binding protein